MCPLRTLGIVFMVLVTAASPEAKLRARLARVWVEYAQACVASGARTEGERAIEQARAADPEATDLEAVALSVDGLDGEGEPDPKRRTKAHRDAARICDKLAKHDASWAAKAVELDPSKSRINKMLGAARKLAGNRKNVNDAGKLLLGLRRAAPDSKSVDKAERAMALSDVAVIRGKDHPLVGYLSLPKGWKPGKEYDVLVAVDGAGSGFLGAARGFAKTRGKREVIVLAPCTFANTNELTSKKYPFYSDALLKEHNANRFAFDLAGLLQLLDVVRERYGGRDKITITGFSGGGNLCYGFLLTYPERVLCAAPACTNFSGMGARDAKEPEDGGPPVHIMTGEKDKHREFTHGNKNSPGIEPQTDNAERVLKEKGFKRVKRTMLKGKGHNALRPEVWGYYDEIR